MAHRVYISTNEDVEILRESIAWSSLRPEEMQEAHRALERVVLHMIQLDSLLEEAYHWLMSNGKFPREDYGDFLARYHSFKKETEELEK